MKLEELFLEDFALSFDMGDELPDFKDQQYSKRFGLIKIIAIKRM